MDPYPAIVLAGNIAVGATDWLGGQTDTGSVGAIGTDAPSSAKRSTNKASAAPPASNPPRRSCGRRVLNFPSPQGRGKGVGNM